MSKYKLAKTAHPVSPQNALDQQKILLFGAAGVVAIAILTFAVLTLFAPKSNFVPLFTGGARVELAEHHLDFGDVKYEEPVTAEFTLRNVGDEPLNILGEPYLQVVEGCCPPRLQVGKTMLQPGEETVISTTFTMHEGMGGAHDFRIHLLTDDAVEPNHELTILSNWIP